MGIYSNRKESRNEKGNKMNIGGINPVFVPDENCNHSTQKDIERKKSHQNEIFALDLRHVKVEQTAESFDPFLHRNVEHPTTNYETLFHLLKGCLGTGVLAMPKAFSNSGYLLGTIGTVLIGAICIYCMHLLIKCEYELCKRRKIGSLTYPATAEAALSEGPDVIKRIAPYTVHVVNGFLLVYQIGTCCVYVVFIAENIQSVVSVYTEEIRIEIYMLILLLPLIFISWIRNLKMLAPLSTVANAITFVSFIIIVYYLSQESLSFEDRDMFGKIENLPLFFGTVLFALEAIGVIMPLENEMKTPKSFGGALGVLNIGMGIVTFLYMSLGLLGYLSYGDYAQGSVTLNLPPEEILAQVVKICLAFAIFITYALQGYVAVDITWNEYLGPKFEKSPRKNVWEYVVRTCIVLITFLMAVTVPALDLFISLFGALCLSALGIAIPATIQTFTYWYSKEGASFYIMLIKNIILIIFSLSGLVAGTYTSLRDIIKEFS